MITKKIMSLAIDHERKKIKVPKGLDLPKPIGALILFVQFFLYLHILQTSGNLHFQIISHGVVCRICLCHADR